MKKHQSYWQEDLSQEDLNNWLGKSEVMYKTYSIDYVEEKNYQSLIDCGGGVFTQYDLIQERGLEIRYVGTEITKKFIDIGTQKKIEVYHCPVQKMNVPDNYCEVALCLAVLNHQMEFRESIQELLRVAKEEVIISFFKPFFDSPRGMIEVKNIIKEFPVLKKNRNVGITVQRNEKFVYTYFFKNKIIDFLNNLPVDYFFHTLEDNTIMLHIVKQGN